MREFNSPCSQKPAQFFTESILLTRDFSVWRVSETQSARWRACHVTNSLTALEATSTYCNPV